MRKTPSARFEFPRKLFNVLENETLAVWIHWHQDEGLLIPNVEDFVNHALHRCFPKMKGWESFQRQMSNYGFVKRGWNKSQAHYVHWDNKLCRGRLDLVSQVKRRPKDSTYQDSVQEQPPASDTPAVPQPLGQPNLDARIQLMLNKLAELERRLEVAEVEAAKVPGLEKRLEVAEAELAKVPGLERQLREMDTLLKSPQGAGLSLMNGLPNTQVHKEPVEGAVSNMYLTDDGAVSSHYPMDEWVVSNQYPTDEGAISSQYPMDDWAVRNQYPMDEGAISSQGPMDEWAVSNQYPVDGAGHSSSNHDESLIGTYDGGVQLRNVSSHMGPKTTISLPEVELDGHARLPNNNTPFAGFPHTPRHAPVVEVSSLTQGGIMDDAGLTSRPSYGASAAAQTSTLGVRGQPVFPVPPQSPPLSWKERFFGPSNSGQQ